MVNSPAKGIPSVGRALKTPRRREPGARVGLPRLKNNKLACIDRPKFFQHQPRRACIDKKPACGVDHTHALYGERALSSSRPRRPAGIMSDGSDDVSPPTADPLLFEILRTIETAKEMPDDCPMHLQDFFDLVSARASLTPSLPNRLRMGLQRAGSASRPASIAHSGHCRFPGVHARVHCLRMHLARRTAQDVASRSAGAARAHHKHAWLPSLQVQRAHRFSHPPHSQVCRLVHGKKGYTGTKAWLAKFLTPAFTNAVCKLYDVLRLARTSGHYRCDDQVRPLARAARNESVPVHWIERPPGTARPSAVHSHCAPRAHTYPTEPAPSLRALRSRRTSCTT